VGHKKLEEARTLNGKIERVAGRRRRSLCLDDFRRSGANAKTDLQTGCNGGLLRGRGAGHDLVLVKKIGELNAPLLETRCAGVRKVVGDVVEVQLLGRHAASGG